MNSASKMKQINKTLTVGWDYKDEKINLHAIVMDNQAVMINLTVDDMNELADFINDLVDELDAKK